MKTKFAFWGLALMLALSVLPGCRREDVRSFTVRIPGLTEKNKVTVEQALARYDGIRKDSYKWDMANKTLTLEYDSIRVAKTNIRMSIEEKGIAVDYETH